MLSHIIFYVKDVPKALAFYKDAFGLETKFLHESGAYGELETGTTALAFASESLGEMNLKGGFLPFNLKQAPQAGEVVLTVDDVAATFKKAVEVGGIALEAPAQKPWGQTVAYIRDPHGVLVELASPM